jgi:His/Glu/Gln/Arg/opine family amino acid ABC transporter permease subunit
MELLAFGAAGWGDELAEGAWLTLRLAAAALVVGLALGLIGAAALMSRRRALRAMGHAYVTAVRGVPELLVVFVVFFGGGFALQAVMGLWGESGYVEIDAFAAGMAALGLMFGAYASEVFAGAYRAVPKGEIEAARALGLAPLVTARLVVWPHVWRLALPGLGNLWLVLLKDTSLVSVIALDELTRMANVAVGASKQPFTVYTAAAAVYLAMTAVSMVALGLLERRAAASAGRGR